MADEETRAPQADEAPDESSAVLRDGPAWENRESLGIPKAVFETVKAVAFDPVATFEKMKLEGGVMVPMTFAIVMMVTAGVGGSITSLIRTGSFIQMMAMAAFFSVLAIISPFISAGLTHLVLKLIDAVEEPFEVTYRTVCYAYAPMVFGILPIVGMLAMLYHPVCIVIGLTKTQKCSIGQAIAAVLAPMVLFMCLGFGLVLLLMLMVGVAVTSPAGT